MRASGSIESQYNHLHAGSYKVKKRPYKVKKMAASAVGTKEANVTLEGRKFGRARSGKDGWTVKRIDKAQVG